MTLWEELLPLTRQLHGRVLDAGCGNGEYSRRLRALPGVEAVVSLDLEPGAPLYAYGQDVLANTELLVRGDVQDMRDFPAGSFDCAMAWHVIEHCAEPHRALRELARVTRDLIMISLPVRGHCGWDSPEHRQVWTVGAFHLAAAAAGLYPAAEVYRDQCGCQNWLFCADPERARALRQAAAVEAHLKV